MNINATLIGQFITFGLFVWFVMKFVWPPLMNALNDREGKIAEGLAAAERGHHELALAQEKAKTIILAAREEGQQIVHKAQNRADKIVDDAKAKAKDERDKILEGAEAEVSQAWQAARESMREQIGTIAITGAEKILSRQIDAAANADLIDALVEELR